MEFTDTDLMHINITFGCFRSLDCLYFALGKKQETKTLLALIKTRGCEIIIPNNVMFLLSIKTQDAFLHQMFVILLFTRG